MESGSYSKLERVTSSKYYIDLHDEYDTKDNEKLFDSKNVNCKTFEEKLNENKYLKQAYFYISSLSQKSSNHNTYKPAIQHNNSINDISLINELESLLCTGYNSITAETASFNNSKKINFHSISENESAILSYEWNSRFQHYLELPASNTNEILRKYGAIFNLTTDFVSKAKGYAKIIILEHLKREKDMTIQPKKIGGFAGGSKYIVDGILFKFAKDPSLENTHMYGSYEFCAKACSHELKGAASYLSAMYLLSNSAAPLIRVPMYVTLQFRGFTMTAMPVLPLKELVYGSCDAGKTINHSNENINILMKEAANILHLAEHPVRGINITSSGDTEVHTGKDDRAYLLDLSRVLPPESFQDTHHLPILGNPVYFRLFRKEFLMILAKSDFPPLSSDSMSQWGIENCENFNQRTVDATNFLINQIIPSFARELSKTNENQLSEPVSESVHRRGINIRHIGLLRSLLDSDTQRVNRDTLLVEIIARTLKNLLRSCFRHLMYSFEPSEYAAKRIVLLFLNYIVFSHPNSNEFWTKTVIPGIKVRFGEISLNNSEYDSFCDVIRPLLFRIVQHTFRMICISLSQSCLSSIEKKHLDIYQFQWTIADIMDSEVRIRYMSILDMAKGKLLLTQALDREISPESSSRLLYLAEESFTNALSIDPINDDAIVDLIFTRAMKEENTPGHNAKADYYFLSEIQKSMKEMTSANFSNKSTLTFLLFHKLIQLWTVRREQFGLFPHFSGASSYEVLSEVHKLLGSIDECKADFIKLAAFRQNIIKHTLSLLIDQIEVDKDINKDSIIQECADIMTRFCDFSQQEVLEKLSLTNVFQFQSACAKLFSLRAFSEQENLGVHGVLCELKFDAQTAFFAACSSNEIDVVQSLLKLKGHVNAECLNYNGFSGLHIASIENYLGIVKVLVESGMDINIHDKRGGTPLICAIRTQNLEIVDYLLSMHADVNYAKKDHYSPLIWAVHTGSETLVRLVLRYNPNIDYQTKSIGTALHLAILHRNCETAETLLQHGADINAVSSEGRTALHKAAYEGLLSCTELLLRYGADIHHEDKFGWTPVSSALLRGHNQIVQLLVNKGAIIHEIIEEEEDSSYGCTFC